MKRGLESSACGLEQILLFTALVVAGLLPTVRSVWGEDGTFTPTQTPPALPAALGDQGEATFDVDQVHAQLTFLSVPTELVDATVKDWILTPFNQADVAAADPFAAMNHPLPSMRASSDDQPRGQVSAGTEMRLPSTHKVLNEQEATQLISQLEADERTQVVFSPQLAFIDGMTATAVTGERRPFVVGWTGDDLPQTRVVPQGKMVRLRSVLEDDKMWLDYEIVVSRILDVTSRSIQVANRPQPIVLAVPHLETVKAAASVEMPVGGTLLIGGLPAESKDGVPYQLVVLIRAGRMRGLRLKQTALADSVATQQSPDAAVESAAVAASPTSRLEPATSTATATPKRRNPFSLISRILNRGPKQSDDTSSAPANPKLDEWLEAAPQPPQ